MNIGIYCIYIGCMYVCMYVNNGMQVYQLEYVTYVSIYVAIVCMVYLAIL